MSLILRSNCGYKNRWELHSFPCNHDIVVSTSSITHPELRRMGVAQEQHTLRIRHAQQMGYSAMLATVRDDSEAQRAVMEKNSWKQLFNFTSFDGNSVTLWGININEFGYKNPLA